MRRLQKNGLKLLDLKMLPTKAPLQGYVPTINPEDTNNTYYIKLPKGHSYYKTPKHSRFRANLMKVISRVKKWRKILRKHNLLEVKGTSRSKKYLKKSKKGFRLRKGSKRFKRFNRFNRVKPSYKKKKFALKKKTYKRRFILKNPPKLYISKKAYFNFIKKKNNNEIFEPLSKKKSEEKSKPLKTVKVIKKRLVYRRIKPYMRLFPKFVYFRKFGVPLYRLSKKRKFLLKRLDDIFYRNLQRKTLNKIMYKKYFALLRGDLGIKLKKFTKRFKRRFFWRFLEIESKKYGKRLAIRSAGRINMRLYFGKKTLVRFKVLQHILQGLPVSNRLYKINPNVKSGKIRSPKALIIKKSLRDIKFASKRAYIRRRKLRNLQKKELKGILVLFMETRNNFVISCVNNYGELIYYVNASSVGSSGKRKRFPYTAELCGKRMRKFLQINKVKTVSLVIKSRMRKRMREAIRGFMQTRIKISHVLYRLPLTHNGVRAKKPKRK